MHHPSVTQILDLGEAMLSALDAANIDEFSTLLEKRGRLVRGLSADLEAEGLTDEARAALNQQGERLVESMRTTRKSLGAAVSAISRFRGARKAYRTKTGAPVGRLNKSLHG